MFESLFDYFSPTKRLLKALLKGESFEKIVALIQNPKIDMNFYGPISSNSSVKYSLLTASMEYFYNDVYKEKPLNWMENVQKLLLAYGAKPQTDPRTLFLAIHTGCFTDELLKHYPTLTNNYYKDFDLTEKIKIPLLTYFCLKSPAFTKDKAMRLIQKDPAILYETVIQKDPAILYEIASNGEKPLDYILRLHPAVRDSKSTQELASILDIFPQEEVNSSLRAHYCTRALQHTIEFIKHGVDVHTTDTNGDGLVFLTLKEIYSGSKNKHNMFKILDFLKTTDIDFNAKNNQGETPLTALLKLPDKKDDTLLDHGFISIVTPIFTAKQFLGTISVDVTAPNNNGETPLICLVKQPYLSKLSENHQTNEALEFIRILLEKGVDPHAQDNTGKSAVDYIQSAQISDLDKSLFLELFEQGVPVPEAENLNENVLEETPSQENAQTQEPTRVCILHAQTPQRNDSAQVKERGTQG